VGSLIILALIVVNCVLLHQNGQTLGNWQDPRIVTTGEKGLMLWGSSRIRVDSFEIN